MENEELRGRIREVAREVLGEELSLSVTTWHEPLRGYVNIDVVDQDTGQVEFRTLTSTLGEVRLRLWAKEQGLLDKVETLSKRLMALAPRPPSEKEQWELKVLALAQEALEPAGHDAIVEWQDDGHLAVGLHTFDEEQRRFEFELLATTRGVAPVLERARRFGLEAQARTLATKLGALGFQPIRDPEPEDEAALVPGVVEAVIEQFEYAHHPLDRLFDSLGMPDWDEIYDDRLQRRVLEQVCAHVRARAEEEKTWPDVIPADRLEAAFDVLRARGFVAEMSASTTMSGGWEVSRELADMRREQGETIVGTVFFHQQDAASAMEGHPLHLAYGLINDEEDDEREEELTEEENAKVSEDAAAVGRIIVEVLREHGFTPEWSGDAHSRITLKPAFVWRRRRARVDTTETWSVSEGNRIMALLVEFLPKLRAFEFFPGDTVGLHELRSASLRELTLCYEREEDARDALSTVVAQARERFPALESLTVRADDFEETVEF
ncbi:hypothetical protein SAMN05443572_10154 [Myxococcus fulvus]|uniref:DUF6891 domain-containing protein n=1 Tax=Myxococcus fulvus TaxID=33 RepID=A0A511T189_MYXFU|nr:hypothetical protein [Myxococcus fulvus]GEN07919.1 hypothetical protein MFU01_29560 [Myxococcus fulvus]SES75202.1 hypothetical protein SAMN05443572_10154 [Myxococcus fulvus]